MVMYRVRTGSVLETHDVICILMEMEFGLVFAFCSPAFVLLQIII